MGYWDDCERIAHIANSPSVKHKSVVYEPDLTPYDVDRFFKAFIIDVSMDDTERELKKSKLKSRRNLK